MEVSGGTGQCVSEGILWGHPIFLLAALMLFAPMQKHAYLLIREGKRRFAMPENLSTEGQGVSRTSSLAVSSAAAGALALGAFAVGAFALGALAVGVIKIGRMRVRRSQFGEVRVGTLVVKKLKVLDLEMPEREA
jgi:hypothetical protein